MIEQLGLDSPSVANAAVRTLVQDALGPAAKSPHVPVEELVTGAGAATHPEDSPFTLKASNSTAPLENWNFTALSKSTAPTVRELDLS